MSIQVRLAVYAALILLTAWFGLRFYNAYEAEASGGAGPITIIRHSHKKKPATNSAPTLAVSTNSDPASNAVVAVTNDVAAPPSNQPPAVASASATDTNHPAATPPAVLAQDQDPTSMNQLITGSHQGSMVGYLALFVLAAVGLALLVAHDVTAMIGGKAGDYLYHDMGGAHRDPEYDKAEQVWANGQHLEAIQMMRDYYKRNPRQVHAAVRIAEIYEKDLRNYLAAALEYEELLKLKLSGDRWGWTAIHLCNLYSRIGQQEKTMPLLQRIAEEHPKTAAAKKARQRLGLPEPDEETESAEEEPAPADEAAYTVDSENSEWPTEIAEESSSPPPEEPKSNLPPGFRPKK